jgi:hypothetical protein
LAELPRGQPVQRYMIAISLETVEMDKGYSFPIIIQYNIHILGISKNVTKIETNPKIEIRKDCSEPFKRIV